MSRRWHLRLVGLALAISIATPSLSSSRNVRADDSATRSSAALAKAELQRIQEQIRTDLEVARKAQDSRSRRLRELESETRARTRTVELLQKEVSKKRAALTASQTKLQEQLDKRTKLESDTERFKALFVSHLETMKAVIDSGIPWHKEQRTAIIDHALASLSDKATAAVAGLGSVGRLQKDLESLGRLVERSGTELVHDGETIKVELVHVGMLAVIFSNEDGSLIGYAGPGQSLEQGLAAVAENPEAKNGYVRAIEILKRRRTPALVDLFLPFLPVYSEGE